MLDLIKANIDFEFGANSGIVEIGPRMFEIERVPDQESGDCTQCIFKCGSAACNHAGDCGPPSTHWQWRDPSET